MLGPDTFWSLLACSPAGGATEQQTAPSLFRLPSGHLCSKASTRPMIVASPLTSSGGRSCARPQRRFMRRRCQWKFKFAERLAVCGGAQCADTARRPPAPVALPLPVEASEDQ